MGLGLSGLRLGLGQRGGGASVSVPVLSNFTDNLDQDPPNALFDSTEAGTLTWDFDASATPPAKGAGSIGTGTDSVTSGANNINIDLSAYPGETGYLHLRVANAAGDSNVLTSQQITTPAALVNLVTNGGFDADTDWSKTGTATISGGVANLPNNGVNVNQTVTLTDGNPYLVGFTAIDLSSGALALSLGTFDTSNADHATVGVTADGVYSMPLWAGTSDIVVVTSANASSSAKADDVFVYELSPGVLANPLFSSDTAWAKTGTASISGSLVSFSATNDSVTQSGVGITEGVTYRVMTSRYLTDGSVVVIDIGGTEQTLTAPLFDFTVVAGSSGDYVTIKRVSGAGLARLWNIYVGAA